MSAKYKVGDVVVWWNTKYTNRNLGNSHTITRVDEAEDSEGKVYYCYTIDNDLEPSWGENDSYVEDCFRIPSKLEKALK